MDKDIILVGGFHEMIELCEKAGYNIVGIIDGALQGDYYGYPVVGSDKDATLLFPKYSYCRLVLSPDSPIVRKKLVGLYRPLGFDFATVVSPDARISKSATIGEGTIIQSGVNVSSSTRIGCFCKLNTNANVMHDNVIADYVTIAPNAVSLGRINIGECAYIGANCTILPERTIGEYTTIGAGAVVTRDVSDNKTVKGVPAK